ncbi:MAG: metal-sensing transcriptional repressor [Patescibacteria group bacterium]|jgi:DNA-binding FrmR family transcriptional regulator
MNQNKQKALLSYKKASSLLKRIIEMTESDTYCMDIMQQNLAAIGLLKSAHQTLMENHLNTCFKTAMEKSDAKRKQRMIEEILKVSKLASK